MLLTVLAGALFAHALEGIVSGTYGDERSLWMQRHADPWAFWAHTALALGSGAALLAVAWLPVSLRALAHGLGAALVASGMLSLWRGETLLHLTQPYPRRTHPRAFWVHVLLMVLGGVNLLTLF